jgi:flagellar biosynthesis anti-sigma factor FlgM
MKVTDIQGSGVRQLQTEQAAGVENRQTQRSEATAGAADNVQLSDKARLMQKAGQVIAQGPDVRTEKVASIAQAVQEGTYQVKSTKVANSLIASMIQER